MLAGSGSAGMLEKEGKGDTSFLSNVRGTSVGLERTSKTFFYLYMRFSLNLHLKGMGFHRHTE